ncbi:MAG: aldo/keto reductase [Microbacteriaceae bacterium]|nr:aldo/keto reductase [Microbacteriaceae bacterium]
MTHDAIGFGTWPFQGDDAERAVATAVEAGYRLIDTATKYGNEAAVGRGLRASGVDLRELRIQTKLRGDDHGDVRGALGRSLEALGVDALDAWLIHWPLPMLGRYPEAWAEMVRLREEGLVREIGVSNFLPEHLDALERATGVRPAVNQIQCDPTIARGGLRDELRARGIGVQAWSPLGRGGEVLRAEPVLRIAAARGLTPAEVVLAWHGTLGIVPIARSADAARQRQNLAAVALRLDADELAVLAGLPQRGLGDFDPRLRDER